jgi:hypothetical protein
MSVDALVIGNKGAFAIARRKVIISDLPLGVQPLLGFAASASC